MGVLQGCHFFKPAPVSAQLRIGINSWPGYALAYYAQTTGLFQKRGLKVELIPFSNQQDNIRATMRGAIDASFVPLWEVLQVDPGEDQPAIVLVTDVSAGSDGIVARTGINAVAQLSGRKVGVKLGTVPHLVLLEALSKAKISPLSVKITDLLNEASIAELKQGKVDAAVIWEPFLSETAKQIKGKVIFTTRDVNSLVIDTLATREQYASQNSAVLKQFTLAWFDATQAVQRQPQAVFKTIATQIGQNPQKFADSYAGLKQGDRSLNQEMFQKGRLTQAIQQTKLLLQADPRHNRVIRQDVSIQAQPVEQAAAEWRP